MLTTPLPVASVCIRSAMSSIGSPKNCAAALALEREQAALDRADRRRRDVAVLGRELRRVVADVLQHRAQVLEVEQQQPVVVGDLEHQRAARLPASRSGRACGRAAAAPCRTPSRAPGGRSCRTRPRTRPGSLGRPARASSASRRSGHLRIRAAGLGDAGEVAFHVGHEHRHADRGEALRQRLQRDGLAGAGGAGDQAVAVGERRQERELASCRSWR